MASTHRGGIEVDSSCRLKMQRALSHRRHAPEAFNVMVAGRSGVGKSTFLQTLCDSFYALKIESLNQGSNVIFESAGEHSRVRAEEVLDPFCVFDTLSATKEIRRCVVEIRDLQHHQPIRVELIDTPGIDDADANTVATTINELSCEIERRLRDTLEDEMKTRRDRAFFSSLIHAVIYLIPPPVCSTFDSDSCSHRPDTATDILTDTDILAIKQLGKFANVILAVGKCDTISISERNLIRDGRFFDKVHELISPVRLFGFYDLENSLSEPKRMVSTIQKQILPRVPFFLCGSMHVDEWQQMRLPEYQTSSQSHVTVQDWRALSSDYNRICAQPSAITKGIFSERRQNARPDASRRSRSHSAGLVGDLDARTSGSLVSVRSLRTQTDSVLIKRLHQRREVFLVRDFVWGYLQINNPQHCDFALLVDIVFHAFRQSLEIWTDRVHYETFRKQRLSADPKYRSYSHDMTAYFRHERASKNVPKPARHVIEPLRVGTTRSTSPDQDQASTSTSMEPIINSTTGRGPSNNAISDADVGAAVIESGIPSPCSVTSSKTESGHTATPQFAFQFHLPGKDGTQSPPDTAATLQSKPRDPLRSSKRLSGATTLAAFASICSPAGPSKRSSTASTSRRDSSKPVHLQRHRRYTIGASTQTATA